MTGAALADSMTELHYHDDYKYLTPNTGLTRGPGIINNGSSSDPIKADSWNIHYVT